MCLRHQEPAQENHSKVTGRVSCSLSIPTKSILTLQTPPWESSTAATRPWPLYPKRAPIVGNALHVNFRIDESTISTLGWPGHRKGVSATLAELHKAHKLAVLGHYTIAIVYGDAASATFYGDFT